MQSLLGQTIMEVRMLQASVGSVPSSTGGSVGSRSEPIVLDDEDDEPEVVVRVEREETRVPSPYPRTLVEIVEPDQSIDLMEERFMSNAGILAPRELRWPPLDEDEVVPSSVAGELTGEELETFRDFAEEEREQALRDRIDPEVDGIPESLAIADAIADPSPPYEERPAPYTE